MSHKVSVCGRITTLVILTEKCTLISARILVVIAKKLFAPQNLNQAFRYAVEITPNENEKIVLTFVAPNRFTEVTSKHHSN